jgi:ABC-2 type transport system ATP-binding protein/lipopolysaccharide transport system ATP-binding protein
VKRVEFHHVSKRYELGSRLNAREALAAAARRVVLGRHNPTEELWSLRDVSFSVADGEAVGLVGRNGAGKSTSLKVLTGITAPTMGVSRTRGRVAALLEVGTGFHSELTGRENVYLNGAILGMSRRDIAREFDRIVDFSGVERFLDTPVKHYSSGMYLRLAFAVAAHLDPDILLVDEILAVGDAEFQRKCLGRMEEAGQEGRTLIFVSHDLETVSRLCHRALWLEAGSVREAGPSREIVSRYLASGLTARRPGGVLMQSGAVTVTDVRVLPQGGPADGVLLREDALRIEVDFNVLTDVPGLDFSIHVSTSGGVRVLDEAFSDGGLTPLRPGSYAAKMTLPPLLNVGEFVVGLWFGTAYEDLMHEPAVMPFTLHGADRNRPTRVMVLNAQISVHPRPA